MKNLWLSLLLCGYFSVAIGAVAQSTLPPPDSTSSIANGVHLEDVVVYGAHNNFGVVSSQMSAIELSKKQIMSTPVFMGEPDVLKTLQKLPGVQSSNDGTASFFVRGGDYDQNYITLDGAAIYNAEHMKGFVSAINPDVVQSINFYRGGFPARYGSRLSSVLDVGIKTGDFKKYHGLLSLGMLSGRFQVEGPVWKGHTSFNIAGRMSYMGLIAMPILKSIYDSPASLQPYENMNYYDLSAKVVHKFNAVHRLSSVVYFGKDKDLNSPTTSTSHFSNKEDVYVQHESQYEQDSKRSSGMTNKWYNIVSSIYWTADFNKNFRLNTNLSFSQYNYWLNYESLIQRETHDWYRLYHQYYETSSIVQKNDISDMALTIDANWKLNNRHNIRTGIKMSYQSLSPGMIVNKHSVTKSFLRGLNYTGQQFEPEYKVLSDSVYYKTNKDQPISSIAVYAEDDFSLSKRLKLNFGVRGTAFMIDEKSYFSLEPRMSMRYLVSDVFSVKMSYSRMSQAIHRLISGNLVMASDIWVPITKEIPPMTSDLYGVAFNYNMPFNLELSVEGYYKTLNHVLDYRNGSSAVMSEGDWETMVAVGKGRSYGVELMLERRVGNTTGWMVYTWSKALRKFDRPNNVIDGGREFYASNDRRHNFSVNMSHHIVLSRALTLDLSASLSWQSGRRGTIPYACLFGYTIKDYNYKVNDGHFSYWDAVAGHSEVQLYETCLLTAYQSPLQLFSYKTRNDFKLPDVHHLDITATLTHSSKIGDCSVGLSLYNIYNHKNISNVYVGYDKNHLVLKGICPFPFMPSLILTYKF